MTNLMAYCGITCSECRTYLATQSDDDQQRIKVAKEWSEEFGLDLKAEDINCDGCPADSDRLFPHCATCKLRVCVREKSVDNCAHCADYGCDTMAEFLKEITGCKSYLEEERRKATG